MSDILDKIVAVKHQEVAAAFGPQQRIERAPVEPVQPGRRDHPVRHRDREVRAAVRHRHHQAQIGMADGGRAPTALDQQRWVDAAIDALAGRGVDAIVLGCTELPVAWAGQVFDGPARLVDATTALARACVDWHRFSGSMPTTPASDGVLANRTMAHGNPLARRLPVAG